MSDLIPDEEQGSLYSDPLRRAVAEELIDAGWDAGPHLSSEEAYALAGAVMNKFLVRVSPVTETADYLFENPSPQPVSKEWLAEVENTKSGAEVVSPVTRETLEPLAMMIAGFYHNATDPFDAAGEILEALSVSLPAEDEWCREESCQYRHWRSGSMPTHKRGAGCPSRVPVRGAEQ